MTFSRRKFLIAPAMAGAAALSGTALARGSKRISKQASGGVLDDAIVLEDLFVESQDILLEQHIADSGDAWQRHSGWPGSAFVVGGEERVRNTRAVAAYVSTAKTTPVGHMSLPYTLESARNHNVSILLFVPDAFIRSGYQVRANAAAGAIMLDQMDAGITTRLAEWPQVFEPGDHILTASWRFSGATVSLTVLLDGAVVGTHTILRDEQKPSFSGFALAPGATITQARAHSAQLAIPPIYIDPTHIGPETGTYAQPFKTWAAVLPLQHNRTYLLKSGTVLREEMIIKDANGVTVDVYDGINMAIVDGEDTRDSCVVYGSCDDLVIRNIHATRGTKFGFLMENGEVRNFGPILIEDCRADYVMTFGQSIGLGVGFQLWNLANVEVSLLTVRRVTCEHNARVGFDQQRWGGTAEYYDIVSRYNAPFHNGGGFYSHPWRQTATGPWVNTGGQLWEWALPSTLDKPGYVGDRQDDQYGKPFRPTNSPTPGPGEFHHDEVNQILVINLHDPAGDPNVRGIQIARSTMNVLVDGAEVSHNGAPWRDIDASGFQFDDMSHNVIARNIHSHHNQGAGIACHQTFNALIENCVSEYNAQDQERDHMWYGNYSATGAAEATFRNITARGDGASTVRAITVGRDCVVSVSGLESEGNSETFYLRERGVVNLISAAISTSDTTVYDLDAESVVVGGQCVDIT